MDLATAIRLIDHPAIKAASTQEWVDLGAGAGLFSEALASLLPPDSTIHAVDKKASHASSIGKDTHQSQIFTHMLDFKDELPFQNLDGVLMANALHYVKKKPEFINRLKGYLKPRHTWIIVEYDSARANPWVPFPITYENLETLFIREGYANITKLHEVPSRFRAGNIYGALIKN